MDTEDMRQILQGEEHRLEEIREDLQSRDQLEVSETESGGETNTVDQHTADAASQQQQREVDLSMLEQVEAELQDVERALQKLHAGTYGTCESCNGPIGEERLKVQPAARFCVDDQAAAELEKLHIAPAIPSPHS